MHPFLLYFFLMIGFFGSCTSSKKSENATPDVKMMSISKEKLGGNTEWLNSPGASYVLCKKIREYTDQPGEFTLEFLVFENKTGNLVLEKSLPRGKIDWYSDHELKWVSIPGNLPPDLSLDDLAKIHDLQTGTERNHRE